MYYKVYVCVRFVLPVIRIGIGQGELAFSAGQLGAKQGFILHIPVIEQYHHPADGFACGVLNSAMNGKIRGGFFIGSARGARFTGFTAFQSWNDSIHTQKFLFLQVNGVLLPFQHLIVFIEDGDGQENILIFPDQAGVRAENTCRWHRLLYQR